MARMSIPALAALLVAVTTVAGAAGTPEQSTPRARRAHAVREALDAIAQKSTTKPDARISRQTGLVTHLTTSRGHRIVLPRTASASAESRARAFLALGGGAFGMPASADARITRVSPKDEVGMEHVRVQQQVNGIDVRGAEMTIHLRGADVASVLARTVPDADAVDTTPSVTKADALTKARDAVTQARGVAPTALTAPKLEILNPAFVQGTGVEESRLAWFIEATGEALRENVWIDARTGDVLMQFSQIAGARHRNVHTANHTHDLPGTLLRSEGGPPAASDAANRAYDYSGDAYDYFFAEHGRDSFDDAGGTLRSVVHYFCDGGPFCTLASAFWDGTQMVYEDPYVVADDIVGHEMTHGVTQHSANLFYCLQSGALNESFSDVFGETIDLENGAGSDGAAYRWKLGEDAGGDRDMMNPADSGLPGRTGDANYACATSCSDDDNGGVHHNSSVPAHAYALAADGGTYNGTTVAGIGLGKVGKVWYRALTVHLTSTSTFADAYDAFNASCADLIGTDGITAADCTQVHAALDAVDMDEPPCSVCGDGNIDPGEACDDGNDRSLDGCESDCTVSPHCTLAAATDLPQPILNEGAMVSTINVSATDPVGTVQVLGLRGRHNEPYLTDVHLIGPTGIDTVLWDNACAPYTVPDFDLSLSDFGDPFFACPMTTGRTFHPSQSLAAHQGVSAAGDWTLTVAHDPQTLGSGGVLDAWSLLVCRPICGDQIVQAGEACDDGNAIPNDGCDTDCTLTPGCEVVAAADVPQSIPPADFSPGVASSSVVVTGAGDVSEVQILDVQGTYPVPQFLRFQLTTPSGTSAVVLEDLCDYRPDFRLSLADGAPPVACPAIDGQRHAPTQPLSTLNGGPRAGTWTLSVSNGFGEYGTLESWKLLVCTGDCGNAAIEPGEACDDGNTTAGDGCENDCTLTPACGNALLEAGEQCDDGNATPNDGCQNDCTFSPPLCGNGLWEWFEDCDDGNTVAGDGCENDCTLTPSVCGNGVREIGEQCDDGNATSGDGCEADCSRTLPVCGNGTWEPGEQCDDGNATDGDGCEKDCTFSAPACGNGFVDDGEACDDANATPRDGCENDCTLTPVCGNGALEAGEECDDRNTIAGDGCEPDCTFLCGNGDVEGDEQCDDGNTTPEDGCENDCTFSPICGNYFPERGEDCDDANGIPGDGCEDDCTFTPPSCGDGVVQPAEHCDDGNAISGDGCEADCAPSDGCQVVVPTDVPWYIGGPQYDLPAFSSSVVVAGTGHVSKVQVLGFKAYHQDFSQVVLRLTNPSGATATVIEYPCADDGFAYHSFVDGAPALACLRNDGATHAPTSPLADLASGPQAGTWTLSADTTRDLGILWTWKLLVCAPICGNGTPESGEACDDGNAIPNDGCESDCRLSPGCGNGQLDAGEQCDDGNTTPGDGCESDCRFAAPACGNGVPEPGEACDDGNQRAEDGCENDCTLSRCGNRVLDAGEVCDDGNQIANDGCEPTCVPSAGCQVIAATGLPQAIPDLASLTSRIDMDGPGLISQVQVLGLRGTHTYLEDLDIQLDYSWGGSTSLLYRSCGDSDDFDVSFADGAPQGSCPLTDGALHRPAGLLASFAGAPQAGFWTLTVTDHGPGDVGTLDAWSLLVCAPICGNGTAEQGEQCDDGNTEPDDGCNPACIVESCPPTVDYSCRDSFTPGKASITLADKTPDRKDEIVWKWAAGRATTKAELGDPLTTDNYQLCLYDGTGLRATLWAPAGGTCGSKPCWKDQTTGFKYTDKHGSPFGIQSLQLKAGVDGKANILVKAKGVNVPMPSLPSLTSPLTVQLRRQSGPCWSATYTAPFKKNDGLTLKDKAD